MVSIVSQENEWFVLLHFLLKDIGLANNVFVNCSRGQIEWFFCFEEGGRRKVTYRFEKQYIIFGGQCLASFCSKILFFWK